MKEELTTAMHAEFTVSKETELKHQAFLLHEMELRGIAVTSEILYERGLTIEIYDHFRRAYDRKFKPK